MAMILKCKMCGGDIEVSQDMTVGTCLFCGSTMTLPRIDSDKKARLFNRANQYRLNNEFDKAYDAYKAIVEEDEQEAEAYWGMLLSEYGVEYVEDPSTKKRVPTCHRTHVQSVRSSTNYKQAIQFADTESRFIYQDEAEVLDQLQKNIIAVSAKEEPYDVFICYKESDDVTGQRTKDSVLAQQIYEALEEKGIRTFFARISLEDKIGQLYEPYIYAALTSARVMIHVTTGNEHSNAVWVKNEWMRFIQFKEEHKEKVLIPAYSEMSPHELPDEMGGFQAQDMGKVGAIQDLVYGITKVLGTSPRESNNQIINELLNEKMSREKRNSWINRSLIFALVGFAIGVAALVFGGMNSFSNGYISFKLTEMTGGMISEIKTFGILIGGAGFLGISGMIYGLIKGYTAAMTKKLLFLEFLVLNIAILILRLSGILVPGIKMLYIINFILVAVVVLIPLENKKRVLLKSLVLAMLFLIGFTKLGYTRKEIGNAENVNSGKQIEVSKKIVNIRESPDVTSKKVGEAYKGIVFDILAVNENNKTTWYKIRTKQGVEGYIRGDLVTRSYMIEITADYINIREDATTSSEKLGKVYKGEQYIVSAANQVWYKIEYSNGETGYIASNQGTKIIQ